MSQHDEYRAFGDPYIPAAQRVIKSAHGGDVEVIVASEQLDNEEATDLIMLQISGDDTKFAFRVRKYSFWEKFPNDFTIRSKVKSDRPTEIHKILDGYGDVFLYAFAVEDENDLEFFHWKLIDLNVFRNVVKNSNVPYFDKQNKYVSGPLIGQLDGSEFRAYNVNSFPPTLIITSSDDAPLKPKFVDMTLPF